jgi:hypothetical protein
LPSNPGRQRLISWDFDPIDGNCATNDKSAWLLQFHSHRHQRGAIVKFYPKETVILACTGLMAAAFSGCGGGGGGQAEALVAKPVSFAVTKDNVDAIVGEELTFSNGIQAVDQVTKENISIPPTTLTISRSAESPTGYAFKMLPKDGTGEISGNFGFGSCIFKVTKSTAVWPKKNDPIEGVPPILIEESVIEIKDCEYKIDGGYFVLGDNFETQVMEALNFKLGTSVTDPAQTPVKIIVKDDKALIRINGQNVGDTTLQILTGSNSI